VRHGRLWQVELDALNPNDLHDLYSDALAPYWDADTAADVLAREEEERVTL